MAQHDDTKVHVVTPLAPLTPDGGHYVGQLDNGHPVEALTYAHAMEHHREQVESGELLPVVRSAPSAKKELAGGDGPAQVASEAYRTGWERIFRGGPPGEA